MLMNAVGIDVSKGKSTVAVMQPFGVVAAQPAEPNAVMEAWMTVFLTGVSPKGVNVSPTTASIIA